MKTLIETSTLPIDNSKQNFRVLSFNIHKGGWFKEKAIALIREQIRVLHPDFIFLQESFGNQFELLAHEFWPHVCYGQNAIYTKGHHGNAILSKFPVTFSKNTNISVAPFDRRGLLHATVELTPETGSLHLLCVHLGLLGKHRAKQLDIIVDYIGTHIPTDEPLIIAGDFNDVFDHAKKPLIEELGLQEAFLHHRGAYAKTFPAWGPMLRLDRIYSRGFDTHSAETLTHKDWRSLSDHIAIHVQLQTLKK